MRNPPIVGARQRSSFVKNEKQSRTTSHTFPQDIKGFVDLIILALFLLPSMITTLLLDNGGIKVGYE